MMTLTTIFKIHKAFGEIVEIAKTINGTTVVCPVLRSDVAVVDGAINVRNEAVAKRAWFFRKVK